MFCDATARDAAAHSYGVEHVRKCEVIDIERGAGNFPASLFTRGRFADEVLIC